MSAVQWYVDGFAARSGIKTDVRMPEDLGRIGNEIEIVLFRVLQESLTNIYRHSGSRTATVEIGADPHRYGWKFRMKAKAMATPRWTHFAPVSALRECASESKTSEAYWKSHRARWAAGSKRLFPWLPSQKRPRLILTYRLAVIRDAILSALTDVPGRLWLSILSIGLCSQSRGSAQNLEEPRRKMSAAVRLERSKVSSNQTRRNHNERICLSVSRWRGWAVPGAECSSKCRNGWPGSRSLVRRGISRSQVIRSNVPARSSRASRRP